MKIKAWRLNTYAFDSETIVATRNLSSKEFRVVT